ncbi:MAG: flagellar basal body-associated FliL family protein [Bosea sp.]|uniref:flagellar basal body-associated FliL family protein n=1 Tax=Bosea sp. (in: a-proteobacteria) TaxID=1871050 RepID=UPI002396719A|nr:flagellar basal body-associated FliL family protein [Bosea sp. (in: a-proteobacteria)]MCP4738150.1 flagellar basal body-associated FliL family protein [Bosea sp. (in: a-proteobacteria)]
MAQVKQLSAAGEGDGTRSGKLRAISGVVLATLVAVGAGILSGTQLAGTIEANVLKRLEATPPALAADAAMAGGLTLKKLAPIITNLADPADTWIRLEVAVLVERKAVVSVEPLIAAIGEDLLAFLRSVSARQLEGAAGLKNLREDLNERAAIRSKGLVRDVVIETLVVQ